MIREEALYQPICIWFYNLLKKRYKRKKILVEDTSRIKLSKWLETKNLLKFVSDGLCYDFKIDITGAIISADSANLILIECKAGAISVKDLSQILGYSKIALPSRAFIMSPAGANSTLSKLITVYGRIDVLNYKEKISKDSVIRICKWDVNKNTIDYNSTLPYGYHP